MTLRIAIVGCGKAAENHIGEIRRQPHVSVVAACDSEPLMAEQFCHRHGIDKSYINLEQLLWEQKPDVVHIATTPQSHTALALMCIEAGCHVFVEKPLADTSDRAAEIIRSAERNRRNLTVGWSYHFDPIVRNMRELVTRGIIGKPVHLDVFQAYDLCGNFGTAVLENAGHWVHGLPGKLLQNNLDHLLSLIVEFLDKDTPLLALRASQVTDSPYPELFDELRLTLADENTSAQIAFSSRARPLGHFLTITGTKSAIRLNIANQTLTQESTSELPGPLGRLAYGFGQTRQAAAQALKNVLRFARADFHGLAGLSFLLSAFYRSIEYDRDVPIPYAHILQVSRWIDQVVDRLHDVEVVYR